MGNRVAGVVLSCALCILCSCEPTLQRRVFEYERQVNARNVERVLALFSEDATVDTKGATPLRGKEAIRGLAEWDSVMHTHLTFHEMVTEGDTVMANVAESNDWLSVCGIEILIHPTTLIIFRDGLIARIESETDTAGTNAVRRALEAVLEWALAERPQVVHALVSDKGFRYNAQNATLWLQLLEEWKKQAWAEP
jgi:hypothetical protein